MKTVRLITIGLSAGAILVSTVFAADMVQIFKNGTMQQIDAAKLGKMYPKTTLPKINPGDLRADAIVGWYDSGHNYHAEKMGSKDPGSIKSNPAMEKGTAVQKVQMVNVVKKDGKVQQISASKIAVNPAAARADAIVGWYDSGHNYHAEKMGSKELGGGIKSNPAVLKGKAIEH